MWSDAPLVTKALGEWASETDRIREGEREVVSEAT